MEESNKKIGEELYWRFAKFEGLLKSNLLKALYMISPSFLDLTNSGVPMDWYEYQLSEYFDFCNDANRTPSLQEFEQDFPYKPMGVLRECEVHEDIRTKNTISHEERVAKLSLGFFVKLIKWENVINICIATKKNEYEFLDIVFPKWGVYDFDYYLKDNNAYTDLTKIQDLRNDFAHFRFDIAKLEEAKKLLDEYIFLMEKAGNTDGF